MNHIAIDLGGRESQLCMRNQDGAIVKEARVSTKSLLTLVKQWEPSRVIVETSAEAFRIADAALKSGHEVRVVPATLVKQLGVGARGVKNDRRDAQTLSEVSCRIDLPSVHIPSETSREWKSLCGSREAVLRSRTMLINNARGWLRTQLIRIRTGATHTFPTRLREHMAANELAIPPHIERQLVVIELINVQVKEADKQLMQTVMLRQAEALETAKVPLVPQIQLGGAGETNAFATLLALMNSIKARELVEGVARNR